jgi:hypothetical protein
MNSRARCAQRRAVVRCTLFTLSFVVSHLFTFRTEFSIQINRLEILRGVRIKLACHVQANLNFNAHMCSSYRHLDTPLYSRISHGQIRIIHTRLYALSFECVVCLQLSMRSARRLSACLRMCLYFEKNFGEKEFETKVYSMAL